MGSYVCEEEPGGLEIVRFSAGTVEENLRLDEKLASEAQRDSRSVMRLWWGGPAAVVLGCGDKAETEVCVEECGRRGTPILKRLTAGGTVLQTDGVFNYSYTAPDPNRYDITRVFDLGASLIIDALASLGVESHKRGISDVAVGERKISGNAQARRWRAVLLHGTVLVRIDRDLLQSVLRHPSREPDYRQGREHGNFIVTLDDLAIKASPNDIEEAFVQAARRLQWV